MGYKEAKVTEAKPSQNLLLHSKTALNPYKFRQQLAKSMGNNNKKTSEATNGTFSQPPRHVQQRRWKP